MDHHLFNIWPHHNLIGNTKCVTEKCCSAHHFPTSNKISSEIERFNSMNYKKKIRVIVSTNMCIYIINVSLKLGFYEDGPSKPITIIKILKHSIMYPVLDLCNRLSIVYPTLHHLPNTPSCTQHSIMYPTLHRLPSTPSCTVPNYSSCTHHSHQLPTTPLYTPHSIMYPATKHLLQPNWIVLDWI